MKKGIVSFIDILGFKELVKSHLNDENYFLSIFNGFDYCYHDYKYGMEDMDESFDVVHTFQSFSDSIVTTITTKDSIDVQLREFLSMFELEVQHLASVQYTMFVDYGILIRGSMSFGNIYHDNSILFGEGMVNAYEMEESLAIYPRIIIDPKIIDLIEKYANDVGRYPNEIENFHDTMFIPSEMYKQIRKDNDGLYFIDFLNLKDVEGYSYVPLEPSSDDIHGIFLCYKKRLLEKLNENQTKPDKIKVKYNWLKNYYNDMVKINCKWLPNNRITNELIEN